MRGGSRVDRVPTPRRLAFGVVLASSLLLSCAREPTGEVVRLPGDNHGGCD
jgi:hypothetical protein